MPHTHLFESIVAELDCLMKEFSHIRKDLGYGYRRTFDNGQRCDIIDYGKKGKNILRVGRGARLVRQYPVLHGWFDEVAKVIAKIEIQNLEKLNQKHIIGILTLLDQAPGGIGAFD